MVAEWVEASECMVETETEDTEGTVWFMRATVCEWCSPEVIGEEAQQGGVTS